MTNDELRQMLHDAVPDLAAPEDRLAAVQARVGRTRRRMHVGATLAAVVAVGLAIVVPRLAVNPAHGPEPVAESLSDCPTDAAPRPGTDNRPGPLVRTGATQVTLCELLRGPGPRVGEPRVLTVDVATVVARLNELPIPDLRNVGCHFVYYPEELSLALRYPDGSTIVVWLDRNCGTASADGRTRRSGDILDLFLRLYREHLPTTTATADLPCPSRIAAADLVGNGGGPRPIDEIARQREHGAPFLPSPLARLTLCRYGPVGNGAAPLVRSAPLTQPEPLRDTLNQAAAVNVSTDANGTSTATNMVDCLDWPDLTQTSLVDLVRIADRTGAVAELAVFRSPCAAVFRLGMGGLVPTAELLTLLDSTLGPAR
jgi:hypothetical protein